MSLRRFYFFGFIALIAFDALSQVSFKLASIHAEPFSADVAWLWRIVSMPWIYGALVGYLGAFVTWMTLLRQAPIGPAFAASHLEIIPVMIVSAPLFNEQMSTLQLVGAAVIVAGVACLAISETGEHG